MRRKGFMARSPVGPMLSTRYLSSSSFALVASPGGYLVVPLADFVQTDRKSVV